VREAAGVKDVIPYFQRRLSLNYGVDSISVTVYGIEQEKLQSLYKDLTVDSGNLVDSYDPTGVLLGSTIAVPASDLYQPLNLDGLLVLQGQAAANNPAPSYSFIVKGILAPYGAAGFVNLDETVFVSLTAARMVFASVYYSGLYVIADSPSDVESVSTSLQNYFGGDAQVFSSSALLSTVQSISSQLTLFLGGVATVSLFVAGVGITNTMFVSVMERTREIGILKSLGYKPRQIMSLFLSEAAVSGVIGSVFGTLFGVGLSYLLGGGLFSFRAPAGGGGTFGGGGQASPFGAGFGPVFSVELIAFSLIFPIGISVLAGLYPAWRASRMNAVAALKYE
jgi:putative ABC transport system permease protein